MDSFVPRRRRSMGSFKPRLVNLGDPSYQQREIAASVLPAGATLSVGGRRHASGGAGVFSGGMPYGVTPYGGGGGGGSTFYHMQRPYLPQLESPDRVQYPRSRIEANEDWRLFHRLDPLFGTAIDMYADMLVSDYDIVLGDAKESVEIKRTLEYMCEKVNLIDRLKYIVREYLSVGEAIPHNFFDDELGIWTYIGFHNPDYIEVLDSPIIDMEPILNFVPDDNLRRLLSDGSRESQELKRHLPQEFVSKILARQPIRLSSLNCSFIARKLHPYEIRGTSIASRLWRIFMVEDAVYNSTIAIFRRSAAPVKVLKLGDPASGWIPAPGSEAKLLEMLNRIEVDPASWLIYHYGINFEAWGAQDREVNINKYHDVIERVKLLGLGLSKSFMSGEQTFASAKSGLQVFLRRLLSLRQYLETVWLYPKFFRPISEINEWTTSTPSEVNHRYRIKRTAQEIEEERLLIMPTVKWKNKLDPSVDTDVLQAYKALKDAFQIPVSKSTAAGAVGLDYKEELEKSLHEFKEDREHIEKTLGKELAQQYIQQNQPAKPTPPGTPGAGAKPPGAAGKPPAAAGKDMTDESAPPGSAESTGPLNDTIEAPSGGGLPTTAG